MDYTEKYAYLSRQFDLNKEEQHLLGNNIFVHTYPFVSDQTFCHCKEEDEKNMHPDLHSYSGNCSFRYPVFLSHKGKKQQKAIIMLHGLNERSWDKYLSWASDLAQQSGKAVILFPIAYHMNRSPENWSNPREMYGLMRERANHSTEVSFANVALSTRFEVRPEVFCTSGIQSYYDLMKLIGQIKTGEHPLFEKESSIDFFAYSIGAFLAQILLLSNPDGIFNKSKTFLFCGGASFDEMQGTSRLIMDSTAFRSLRSFYVKDDPNEIRKNIHDPGFADFPHLWRSFAAMLRIENLREFRERCFDGLKNRLMSVSLLKDKIIPAEAILKNLTNNRDFGRHYVLDFPYAYTHESPFPANKPAIRQEVNAAFNRIIKGASEFLR